MKRIKLLLPLLAMTAVAIMADTEKSKPNVILIYADDIGFGDIGIYGSKTIKTPNVDKLAKEGVRFTNAHSSAATSTPSRYSLLTGEYAWRKEGTGIAPGNAASIITPDRYTIGNLFQDAGYHTGAIGKWHLGLGTETEHKNWNEKMSPGVNDIGFNYSYILPATGDRVPCVYMENDLVQNLDPNDPLEVSYIQNFYGEPTGKDNPELLIVMRPSVGHDQTIVAGISRIGYMKGGHSARWRDEEIGPRLTEKAIEFIEQNKEQPFFLYFATHDAHVPRVPARQFQGKSGMGPRGDAILQFDWTVGEVMKALKNNGLDKNTIVILSSDNGPVVNDGYEDQAVELLGNHLPTGPLRGGKCSAFEGGTRVPCIVRWKDEVKPKVSNTLMGQIDLFASFASFLNIQLPMGAAPDSENHMSAWLGKRKNGREYLVTQNFNNNLSIYHKNWKYIRPGNGAGVMKSTNIELGNSKQPQLYNLQSDIVESTNLATKEYSIVKKLRDKLQDIVKEGHFR